MTVAWVRLLDQVSGSADKKKTKDTGMLAPAAVGGVIAGIVLFAAGLYSMIAAQPPPLPLSVALVAVGFGNGLASFHALRRTRLAWAFATSINGTLAFVFLLAAPKLRDLFAWSLGVAGIPAVVLITVTTLLALSAPDLEPGS